MTLKYFTCNGFCHTPTDNDPRYGIVEMVLYNPTTSPSDVFMTIFFEDKPPMAIEEPIHVKSTTNALVVMPEMNPDIFTNCSNWGACLESSTPLIINSICLDGLEHKERGYRGGVQSVMGTELSTQWFFADGVFLQWAKYYKGDISKALFPFNELEYYYLLNPSKDDAHVKMTLQYRNLDHIELDFTIPAQRLYIWDTEDKVEICEPFGVKLDSDRPIATSYVRYIYGLNGKQEWGMHDHFALAGTPGPII